MKFLFTISLIAVLSLDAVRADSNASIRGTDVKTSDSSNVEEVYEQNDKCPVFKEDPKNGNTELGKKMIAATKPCGYYQSQGCSYEVIPANIVHPGEGVGDLASKPYIVQFDIGVNPNIKDRVLNDHKNLKKNKRECIGCDSPGETCLEIIVEGDSKATAGGCAGKCGAGCDIVGAGWAKDCMKHDVCMTYKALKQTKLDFKQSSGFCYDPDCGDEAATTVHNCYINRWMWPDTAITCEKENFSRDSNAYGHWSYTTNVWSGEGPCKNFINWENGQGLPDKDKIRNSYASLAHPESQGANISRAD